MTDFISAFGWIISPTRKIIDLRKKGDKSHAGKALREWNAGWFRGEMLFAILLTVISIYLPAVATNPYLYWPVLTVAGSRINEISYAFYCDALSRLGNETRTSDLSTADRIKMTMKSYVGLLINFAILFCLLPIRCAFSQHLSNFTDAIYFSGVTIATLGYGDLAPVNSFVRLLSLYEVFSGILLIAVAIATYVGTPIPDDT